MLSQGILEADSRGHVFPPGENAMHIVDVLLKIVIKFLLFRVSLKYELIIIF